MQIELAGNRGAKLAQLSVLTNLDSKRLDKVLQALSGKGKNFLFRPRGKRLCLCRRFRRTRQALPCRG